jgi:hypothetical protein
MSYYGGDDSETEYMDEMIVNCQQFYDPNRPNRIISESYINEDGKTACTEGTHFLFLPDGQRITSCCETTLPYERNIPNEDNLDILSKIASLQNPKKPFISKKKIVNEPNPPLVYTEPNGTPCNGNFRENEGLENCQIMVVDFVNGKMVEYPTGQSVPLTGKCDNVNKSMFKTKKKFDKNGYRFYCKLCNYKSDHIGNMEAHLLKHCVRHHFQCVYCGHLFQSRASIFNHMTGRRR